jgi:hypothetical protein
MAAVCGPENRHFEAVVCPFPAGSIPDGCLNRETSPHVTHSSQTQDGTHILRIVVKFTDCRDFEVKVAAWICRYD